jgi:hypothetical protein
LRKVTRNYIIAAVMGLLGLIQLVSGIILWQVLPGGYRGGADGGTFLWARSTWVDIHTWSALVLAAIVIVHIILHWGWIVRLTKSYFKRD